ncbi:hypothetical protein F2Q68_00026206 [Brassica cretica]|uniref:Uncharacterized protein n=1 Tax=Brassica cretica TaxID=69181 RepID=A0A8S9I6K9_BRACR|nr:hypothetical protein F2Q68_00026206 [Brassica cretica]
MTFPFLVNSLRQRRGLLVEDGRREPPIGEVEPFAEERKDIERERAVFVGGGEQQIERTPFPIVDDNHRRRRGRFVEESDRSGEIKMSPFAIAFATERKETEREKEKKRDASDTPLL